MFYFFFLHVLIGIFVIVAFLCMYVCICICVYMCVCIYMCIYVCVYMCICVYIYIYIYIDLYLSVFLRSTVCVQCYLYAPGSKRVTQFQFSVCMYGTCGRIDNKADFDFLKLICVRKIE